MKKIVLVLALALVLTFVFTASAFATTGKFFAHSTSYYKWLKPAVIPPGTSSPAGLSNIGDNPTNPGAHANYLATTAKCGLCHSVHRAAVPGTKLLPTADATCAGCHTGGTAITAKIVTWAAYDVAWVPSVMTSSPLYPLGSAAWLAASRGDRVAAIENGDDAGGGGGPHNDSALDLIADGYWNGVGPTPAPSYTYGQRYGCFTRRCHATNPHGAGTSKYKLFAAKLLFNGVASAETTNGVDGGTYGGDDAMYDNMGATDAAVERFVAANSSIMATTATGDITIHGVAPDANEVHTLVAGLTCGRPSNPSTGHDECHAEASYAIVDKAIVENRNHATGITGPSAYRTDNTGEEELGYGGNDNRDAKTGHVAGSFAATSTHASYAPIASCTSCHDQTDAANSVVGNFTFPHGQTPTGITNAYETTASATTAIGLRSRIWSGYAGSVGATRVITAGTNQKAYDGQCLKCHRDGAGAGIGLTH